MMKKYLFSILVFAVSFVSCQHDIDEPNRHDGLGSLIECTAAPVEIEGDTRTSLTYSNTGMLFSWDDHDEITIWSSDGNAATRMNYQLWHNNGLTASFNSSDFDLKADSRYFGISIGADHGAKNNIVGLDLSNRDNLKLAYSGQRQTVNGVDNDNNWAPVPEATSHLGAYDYMTATGVADGDNRAHLDFKHLGLTLRMWLMDINTTNTPKEFVKLQVYDDMRTFVKHIRYTAIKNGLSGDDYNPYFYPLTEDDLNNVSDENDLFSLDLGSNENGIVIGKDQDLVAFMQVPPMNLEGKTLLIKLTERNGNVTFCTADGKNLQAGKARQINAFAIAANEFLAYIKINFGWKNSAIATRAGDPGVEETLALPKYIYAFFCSDTKLASAVYSNTEITDDDWDVRNGVATYKHNMKFTLEPGEHHNVHLYVVASNTALTIPAMPVGTTTEETIRALTASFAEADGTAGGGGQLKNLYSTPWSSTEFVGDFGSNQAKTLTLEHVASKVDVHWNVADPTADKVTQVQVANLTNTTVNIFKPTENEVGSTASTIYTTNVGDQYNGRVVFYGVQQKNDGGSYPVDVNIWKNGTADGNRQPYNMQYTPNANGATSWIRANITVE